MMKNKKVDAISFSGKIEYRDYLNFNFFHLYKNRILFFFGLFLFVFFVFFIIFDLKYRNSQPSDTLILFIYPVFMFVYPALIYFKSRKIYNSDPLLQEQQNFTVSGKGILLKSSSAEAEIKWEYIYVVYETKNYYYVYVAKNKAFIINKLFFSTQEQADNFKKILYNFIDMKKLILK